VLAFPSGARSYVSGSACDDVRFGSKADIDRARRDLEAAIYLPRFLVLLVVSISSLSAYAQDAKKTADDFATKWVTAYDAGDAAALAALFTQDGVFNAPSGAVVKGRDAIEKALAGRIKAGWTKETITTTDAGPRIDQHQAAANGSTRRPHSSPHASKPLCAAGTVGAEPAVRLCLFDHRKRPFHRRRKT
jgi:hypothetical protein